MTSTTPRNRHFVASVMDAGSAALPYGFAFSGLALGAGAIVTETPLVGACGAVAGVTAGLLSQFRARQYRGQAVALRERLRLQRAQADTANTELRARLSALEIAVWEVKTLAAAPVTAPVVVVEEQPAEPIVEAEPEPAAEPAPIEALVAESLVEAAAEPVAGPVVEAAVAAAARPGLRLAQAAARITVPKTVLDAAVATTGSISLAEIAKAAEAKSAQDKSAHDKSAQDKDKDGQAKQVQVDDRKVAAASAA